MPGVDDVERAVTVFRDAASGLATSIRDMPAALATRIVIGDSLLHAWDLARARDHAFAMPHDLAAAQLEMMQQYYDPSTRGPDRGFALAIDWPADAPAEARLVALSGRHPDWPSNTGSGGPTSNG